MRPRVHPQNSITFWHFRIIYLFGKYSNIIFKQNTISLEFCTLFLIKMQRRKKKCVKKTTYIYINGVVFLNQFNSITTIQYYNRHITSLIWREDNVKTINLKSRGKKFITKQVGISSSSTDDTYVPYMNEINTYKCIRPNHIVIRWSNVYDPDSHNSRLVDFFCLAWH